jgi:CubicO group peptidase (beta-lactamase class C family)
MQWPGGVDTAAAEARLAGRQTLALLVIRRGELVYERYFNGHTRTSVSGSMSVAKSVVSALVGIAVAEGRISSVDEPVTRWLPELLDNDPRFGQITLRHLLLMRSGIAFDEGYGSPFSDAARFYLTDNLQAEVRRLRIQGPPDQAYDYKSGDTQVLAMALQRAVGQPLTGYAESRLWQPMGAAHGASWSLDSAAQGQVRAFCCINATAVDFARFGLLYLHGGQAGGRAVVPADWVRDSTAAQNRPGADEAARRNIESPGRLDMAYYGWQWRRAPAPAVPGATAGSPLRPPGDDFYAEGLHGQFVYIAPATQTVIVRLGTAEGPIHWPDWMGRLAQLNP